MYITYDPNTEYQTPETVDDKTIINLTPNLKVECVNEINYSFVIYTLEDGSYDEEQYEFNPNALSAELQGKDIIGILVLGIFLRGVLIDTKSARENLDQTYQRVFIYHNKYLISPVYDDEFKRKWMMAIDWSGSVYILKFEIDDDGKRRLHNFRIKTNDDLDQFTDDISAIVHIRRAALNLNYFIGMYNYDKENEEFMATLRQRRTKTLLNTLLTKLEKLKDSFSKKYLN